MLKIANTLIVTYVAQIVCIVVNLFLLPVYSKYVGGKIIGLIGVVGMLSTWTGLIESAIASVVTREFAKYISDPDADGEISAVFKSMLLFVVVLFILLSFLLIIGFEIVITSGILFQKDDVDAIRESVVLISIIISLRLIEVFYKSILIGIGLNTVMNLVVIATTCVRGVLIISLGVIGGLSIKKFFVIQLIIGSILVGIYALIVYRKLPRQCIGISRTLLPIKGLWLFSSGILLHNLLVVSIGQLDKLIAIKLTSLVEFGSYTLAASCASVITMIVSPISQIYYPKISRLGHIPINSDLKQVINEAGLVVVALSGAATCVGVVFAESYFKLWLGSMSFDPTLVVVFRIIMIANLLSGFLWVPNLVQFSKDNAITSIKTYLYSLPIQIVALFVLAPRYGAVGCALSLFVVNLFALTIYLFKFNKEVLAVDFGDYVLKRHLVPIVKMTLITILLYQLTPLLSNMTLEIVLSIFAAITCLLMVLPIDLIKKNITKKWGPLV